MTTLDSASIQNKFDEIQHYLNNVLFEREDAIEGLLTCLVSNQHSFLIGPPGTGKSYLIRELCSCISDAQYFDKLLTKETSRSELFGPPSLKALKEGDLKLEMDGYLGTANIVFLDEVFKCNSQTLNSLLRAMNERQFLNGSETVDLPLRCLIGASNELPEDESLRALYDRFTFRHEVAPIANFQTFQKMLMGDTQKPARPTPLTIEEIDFARDEANKVDPSKIVEALWELRGEIFEEFDGQIEIGDRRFKSAVQYLKAVAWLAGTDEVSFSSLIRLKDIFWDRSPKEVPRLVDILRKKLPKGLIHANAIVDRINAMVAMVNDKEAPQSAILESIAKIEKTLPDFGNALQDPMLTAADREDIKEMWSSYEAVYKSLEETYKALRKREFTPLERPSKR